MMSRREFVALLGSLPVLRLLPGDRLGCFHRMKAFKTAGSRGPIREWLKGEQCEKCGHIKVTERVFVTWGRLKQ